MLASVLSVAQDKHAQRLDREFQSAVAQYDAGHLPEAAVQLEKLVREAPQVFEVHELLGLVYAAQARDAQATQQLDAAVRIKPNDPAARTNLATSLIRTGKLADAEEQLKKAVTFDPHSYDANHNLGEVYIREGKLDAAIPYLKIAHDANASSYDNEYDLALAYLYTNKPKSARQIVQTLLQAKNAAELHNLLGQIEEKDGQYVTAANEFETAARQDPSESNLFDWASELLLHQTLEPAIEVFRKAAERYPNSPRVAIGLGIAYYSRGIYDEAVKSLLHAADLSPSDPRSYQFLSKAYDSSPGQADEVIQRFRRFSELQPNDAHASFYYAMSLWKGKRAQDPTLDLHQVESLLKKAIASDPKLVEAHLQLGNWYSDQTHYAEAIPEYLKALEIDSNLPDAHYRLGQAYVHTGEKEKAQPQFEIYQQQRAEKMADLDRQRAEIRQFVYSEQSPAKP
ncbi:MAG TPA: tetratricopeptide repeat protein [Candidatus Sulfotelmatobacter sp.]|jgi:tetratricopeptide (TPR) repeat protein